MTMKITLAILVAAILAYFAYSTLAKPLDIEARWDALLNSGSAAEEAATIQSLTAALAAKQGSWSLTGHLPDGEVNLASFTGDLSTLQHVNATFNWGDNSFSGTGWIPKDPENIYQFFGGE